MTRNLSRWAVAPLLVASALVAVASPALFAPLDGAAEAHAAVAQSGRSWVSEAFPIGQARFARARA